MNGRRPADKRAPIVDALSVCLRRANLHRPIALVVGVGVTAINEGDVFIRGEAPGPQTAVKIASVMRV